ncbi:MAG: Rpn family recombination-promoting nuclease/putative transposase [Gemmatimonadota bacterium]|nr:Rpn family recombination-promoting nuclease/putative transposase [Gemmatimonadota bacterium]
MTSEQAPRYGDMLWECRLRSRAALLIAIEFQSTVDHDMPLRLFEYTARALREWARPNGLGAGSCASTSAGEFGADAVDELFEAPDRLLDQDQIDVLANAVIDCDTADELLARVGDGVGAE